ncbi:MAG: hypothetical protein Q8R83_03900 [Legionellaceae bacterium]|nr:hypothetical protein [Legionellaceae bacterium]
MAAKNNPLIEIVNDLESLKKEHPILYRWFLPRSFRLAFAVYSKKPDYESEYNFLNSYKDSIWFFHKWLFSSLKKLEELTFMQRFLRSKNINLKIYQIIHEHNDPNDAFLAIETIYMRVDHSPKPGKILAYYSLTSSWINAHIIPQLHKHNNPSQLISACIKLIDKGFIGTGVCITEDDITNRQYNNTETNSFSIFIITLLLNSEAPLKLAEKFLQFTNFEGYEYINRPSPIRVVSEHTLRGDNQYNIRSEKHSLNSTVLISNEKFAEALYHVIADTQDEKKAEFIFNYFSAHCFRTDEKIKLLRITRITDQIKLINLFKLSKNYEQLGNEVDAIITKNDYIDTLNQMIAESQNQSVENDTSWIRAKPSSPDGNCSLRYFNPSEKLNVSVEFDSINDIESPQI